jgi:hypothetical protein
VLERLGEVEGTVERELHACQVELITNIHPERFVAKAIAYGGGIAARKHSPGREAPAAAPTRYEQCGVQVGDCWFVASAAVLGRERPFAAGLAVNYEQAADRLDGDCRLAWRSDAMAQTPGRARSGWRSVGF